VLTGLTRTGTPPAAANAWRVLGLAAVSTEAAVVSFARAARLHAAMDLPFEAARLRLAHGERLRRDGGRVEAREHLRAAGDGFRRLGAVTWAARADREIAATDEARRPTRTQSGLTAQEFAVAEVVATGVSTRDAAAQLFLSPKTIEFHLGNVFRKLGVTNRAQLAHVFPTVGQDDHAA
jgi:DNA-binding CsgD family transcriptional regulator